jgi:hypothetical protein
VATQIHRLVAFLAGYPRSAAGYARMLEEQRRRARDVRRGSSAEELARALLDMWDLVPDSPGELSGFVPADYREELCWNLPDGDYPNPAGLVQKLRGLCREMSRRPGLDPQLRQLVDQILQVVN